jgi:flagellar assembly protein FliH
MLSRIVRGPGIQAVRTHTWPQRAGSSASVQVAHTVGTRGETLTSAGYTQEQARALQVRVAELESESDRRVKEARDASYKEGEIAGRTQAAAETRLIHEKLAVAIRDLAELRPGMREQAEADVVRLALTIARRIVHRELNTDPDAVVGLVRAALNKMRLQEAVSVRVHPTHQAVISKMLANSAGSAHIEVIGDPASGLGGAVFETNRGEFDVSVDVQLDEIEKGLTDRLGK